MNNRCQVKLVEINLTRSGWHQIVEIATTCNSSSSSTELSHDGVRYFCAIFHV